jgi:hypothetical protein
MDQRIGGGMDEKQIVLKVVEGYVRTGSTKDGDVKVICLQNNKTSYVEQINGEGRSVMLDEFSVDGKVIWAGYSARSKTVYVSLIGAG